MDKSKRKNLVTIMFVKMVNEVGLENVSYLELCERSNIPTGSFYHIMGCGFNEFKEKLTTRSIVLSKASNYTKLINAGISLSLIDGCAYHCVKIKQLSEATLIPKQTIYAYFKTLHNLQITILRYAIELKKTRIIIQAISVNDPEIKNLSYELKRKVADYILDLQ